MYLTATKNATTLQRLAAFRADVFVSRQRLPGPETLVRVDLSGEADISAVVLTSGSS
jgi:hypothetical protein